MLVRSPQGLSYGREKVRGILLPGSAYVWVGPVPRLSWRIKQKVRRILLPGSSGSRWNPLLLPGGVQPRFCPYNVRPLGHQLRGNRERLVIVGTCGYERFYGAFRPVGSQDFIALVDPISPPSATALFSDPPLVVEAPGYCPPGPKCLFHLTLYRHSRLPGPPEIGSRVQNRND
jgi:hypothetical protein